MASTAGAWGWTLAGVWARLGRVLVPGGVFLPVGVLEAAAGTSGDRGRLLGAAGDGALFLGLGVLRRSRRRRAESLRPTWSGSEPAASCWYLVSGRDLCSVAALGDIVCLLLWTASFVRAFFSFSFSRSLSFFSFFFLSTFKEDMRAGGYECTLTCT